MNKVALIYSFFLNNEEIMLFSAEGISNCTSVSSEFLCQGLTHTFSSGLRERMWTVSV